ncbi:family 43 glycosylhydrolase [Streptomyces camelliae]|uniref:Family 43 glycosylhydrolase n=1 Tax=Streptomyces camelliae TaxID=3004093 RepID=A0ABY7NXU4_9ACTN|nr:family 43 glycosylhydrolase [Streptomyces sp. HUAS 2-6]WBO63066.1 family 43 glycosylhydrolase [Streptomyces sp. HUAS 2-6]
MTDSETELVNPVIRGFAPDPSLVRAGDWYYVATSSFEWFPTIPIHRSRALARWEYAGHVEGAAPGGTLAGVPDSGGIWAPSLSWDGTRFWVTYTVVRSVGTPYFDLDTYISTAPDVAGPWTPPRRVPSHGFDPALFHEEGRLWLLNLQNDHRPGGRRFCGIVATELNPSTLSPVDGTHLLLQHDRLIEGPKLLKRDGWYVLLLAEGGTGFEHGVRVARSRRLTGPYDLDPRPLLTSRDDPAWPLQKAGHAELVRTPDDEWHLSHLTSRPLATPVGPRCPLGRETAIQAVTWDEAGWPRLRHGDCRPALRVPMPRGRGGKPEPAGSEDTPAPTAPEPAGAFLPPGVSEPTGNGPEPEMITSGYALTPGRPDRCASGREPETAGAGDPLAPGRPRRPGESLAPGRSEPSWYTLRSPADPSWIDLTSRAGWIRLRGRHGPESLWAHSLLARRITEHRAEVRVTVEARPTTFTQAAGLLLWYNTAAYLALDLTWAEDAGEEQCGQQWRGAGRSVLALTARDEDETRLVAVADVDASGPLTLGVRVERGEAEFWYAAAGARRSVGPPLDFTLLSDDHGSRLRFTGAMAAIHAVDLVDASFTADFTGFRLDCTPD